MSKTAELKTYRVSYYLEMGFFVDVEARSASQAETLIQAKLDNEHNELPCSKRVHYQDGIAQVQRVKP